MIYGRTSDGGIFIGLSARNLELLKQGKPILREEYIAALSPEIVQAMIAAIEAADDIFDLWAAEGHSDPAYDSARAYLAELTGK